jgi:hypothetical protein
MNKNVNIFQNPIISFNKIAPEKDNHNDAHYLYVNKFQNPISSFNKITPEIDYRNDARYLHDKVIKLHNTNNSIRKRLGLSERNMNTKVQQYLLVLQNFNQSEDKANLSVKEINRLDKYCTILEKENNYLLNSKADSKIHDVNYDNNFSEVFY